MLIYCDSEGNILFTVSVILVYPHNITNTTYFIDVPIVTVPTGAYTVNVGESKTLTCEVTSDPVHTNVYWQKVSGGQTITIDTNLAKYGGSTISSPSLVINNAAFSDSGTYYCFATNAVGTGQSTQVVLAVAGSKCFPRANFWHIVLTCIYYFLIHDNNCCLPYVFM